MASDCQEFFDAVKESVDHVSVWLPWCNLQYSEMDAKNWILSSEQVWKDGVDYRFIIEDLSTKKILGSVAINEIVKANKVGNLGYWVRKSYLNKGICKIACQLAIEYAFKELELQRIEINVLVNNVASNKVAEKLGGVYEGTFRNKLRLNGVAYPARCYSIIPSDYDL